MPPWAFDNRNEQKPASHWLIEKIQSESCDTKVDYERYITQKTISLSIRFEITEKMAGDVKFDPIILLSYFIYDCIKYNLCIQLEAFNEVIRISGKQ